MQVVGRKFGRLEKSTTAAAGIKVCDGLRHFDDFLAVLRLKPTPHHSLGRFGDIGNYSCGSCPQCHNNGWLRNCKWMTDAEQKLEACIKKLTHAASMAA